MKTKLTLQEYTQTEFADLVERITAVGHSKREHDELVQHFDRIVKHPKGSDLLFYPDKTKLDYGV